jgi:hypothetical protein
MSTAVTTILIILASGALIGAFIWAIIYIGGGEDSGEDGDF